MTRPYLTATLLLLSTALAGCIGIEHEDIGGSGGTAGSTATTTGGDGDGDETGDEGDGDGDGDTGGFTPKYDINGGDGDGDGDLNPIPRLFVSGSAVAMWDVETVEDDQVPLGTLPTGDSSALALALGDDQLFVATTNDQIPLALFSNPGGLSDMEAPSGGVGVATGFDDTALVTVAEMHVDSGDNLWIVDDGVRLFEAASALAMGSTYDARFVDDTAGIVSAAHDATGTKLLGAHSTLGVPFWDAPLAAAGSNQPTDFLASSFEARRALVAADDLYVASGDDAFVRVWRDVDTIGAPAAPDVTLGQAVTGLASPVHLYVRGTALVVTDDSNGGRVLVWDDATNLAADQAPDHTIGEGDLSAPTQAILAADGRLFVRDGTGFLVYEDAQGSATLAATVGAELGATTDMVLLECRQDAECSGTCVNGTCM